MTNRIIGGEAPFDKGASIGVGFMGNPSAAFQDLDGQIENVEIITEENKHKVAGKLGWGTAGLVVFGPAGALAGLLLGGKKKEICFACYLKSGKKFVAIAEPSVYKTFLANSFKKTREQQPQPRVQHSSSPQATQKKQSMPDNWVLNPADYKPSGYSPFSRNTPPSSSTKGSVKTLQGCGYIAVFIGFMLFMAFLGSIAGDSRSSLASNIFLLICASSLVVWGLGLISPKILSRFLKDNLTQKFVSKILGWVTLISFILFALTLPPEKDKSVPQQPPISATPKTESKSTSSSIANNHHKQELEAKASAAEKEKLAQAQKQAQTNERRMKSIVIKELASYSKAGETWRNFLIRHNTGNDNLIFLARKLHQEDPNSCFRLLDNDAKFNEFMQWDINYPNPNYPYPESWADNHIIGMVNKTLTSDGGRWELSDGYQTIASLD